MDTATIASLATDLSHAKTANTVQLTVLKKTMDIEAQNALQLVQVATQAAQLNSPTNNPAHLGNRVDTFI